MAAHATGNNDPVDYIWSLIAREGRLPCAGNWHTDAAFKRYVLGRPAFNRRLPEPFYEEELTDEQRRELKAVLSRIDRYGQAVRGTLPLEACLPGLADRLQMWLVANLAPALRMLLDASLAQSLAGRLGQAVRAYTYEADFWAWAEPLLVDELLAHLFAHGICARDALAVLTQDAKRYLSVVRASHGVYGVDAQQVASRAMLIALRTFAGPGCTLALHDALQAELKHFAALAALPVMDWAAVAAGCEDAELRKRSMLLEVFCGLVHE